MFQYIHFHVARLAFINDATPTMDWEAHQDPELPDRVKHWVEEGQSRIERLQITHRD